jgi:porin
MIQWSADCRAGAFLCAICVVVTISFGSPAYAQVALDGSTDLWTRPTLTGDWDGLRPQLQRKGVTFSLNYTTELLANVQGGIRLGAVGDGLFQPQLDADLEKLLGLTGAKFRASGIITHGPGLTDGYVGNLATISNIEAGPVARLYELWYEQNAFNERFSIRGGLMIADTEFTTSEAASTFMNNTFGWNALFSRDLPASGPAYPIPAPGLRVRVKPASDIYLQAAVFSGDPSGGNGSNQPTELPTGTVFSFSGGAFLIGEVGYTPNQGKDAKGLPAAYKLGAWYHTSSRFGDQRFDTTGRSLADPLSNGIPFDHHGDWSIYGVIDQTLYRVPGTEEQGLAAFIRGAASPSDRNRVDAYFDTGLVYTGLIPGRPDDKIGIAAVYTKISDRARALDRDVAFFTGLFYPTRSAERLVELTYRAKVAPWWTVQGDVQYVVRPSGGVLNADGNFRRNALVFGARSVVSF